MDTNTVAPAKQASTTRTITFLAAMLVVSVALNVGLAYKVRGFTSAQEAQLARLEARRLKAGTTVPPLSAKRVDHADNRTETIGYAGTDRPTVLYVLSPACGWCARNERSVQQLIAEKGNQYRFIGISLVEEGVAEYQAAHGLGVPLYAGISQETKDAYKMGGTPQTIVVSPDGVVIANWNGAYMGKQKEAIEGFFKIDLPDIKLDKRQPG